MNAKSLIWLGACIGSGIGSFMPELWGAGFMSASSVILSTIGGLAGIWAGFKLSQMI